MQLFQRLGVSTLPFVFILPGKLAADRERIKLRTDDSLKLETYEKFPWTADEFSTFLTEKTGLSVGRVRSNIVECNTTTPATIAECRSLLE